MKLQRTWVLLVGLLLASCDGPGSARKWTDNTGKFLVEAELSEAKDGNVRLKRQDGNIITVPVSKLSKADRDYLASIAKAEKKPEATKPTRDEVIAAIKKLGGRFIVFGNIEVLNLSDTEVTDAGLEHLKELSQLQVLHLRDTKVTDAGLEHLKELKSLQHLLLGSTNVTDAGLEHLKELKSLQYLYLGNTKVTVEGVQKLKQALPNCNINHYSMHP